ncbi:HAD family hydrolase [Uliginosibacterium sp. sgz301328]|uniref:HAD family hydrolase n=1 Tax=Uliginosibacterium sp. sgz301328 TaxID=3243764 RepID=UPI00359EE994
MKQSTSPIKLIAFDADDTLWRCQDYFDAAQIEFERLLSRYIDIGNTRVAERLLAVERANIALFGYGVKGMALSMIEAAIEMTDARITASDLHRIVTIAKEMLTHPVELLPGIREAVQAIADVHDVVLITKGDLFHQEAKIAASGMAKQFRRIEIVSEKDEATYARLLEQFGIGAHELLMIGNSLRSDILPVLALGGWGVYMPYHTTWQHEAGEECPADHARLACASTPADLPAAVAELVRRAG